MRVSTGTPTVPGTRTKALSLELSVLSLGRAGSCLRYVYGTSTVPVSRSREADEEEYLPVRTPVGTQGTVLVPPTVPGTVPVLYICTSVVLYLYATRAKNGRRTEGVRSQNLE